jgi:hypothetical protein
MLHGIIVKVLDSSITNEFIFTTRKCVLDEGNAISTCLKI